MLVVPNPSPSEHAGHGDARKAPPPHSYPPAAPPPRPHAPDCRKLGRRKATYRRLARTIADKQVPYLDVTYGEYRARCSLPQDLPLPPAKSNPRPLYDNKAAVAVLDHILERQHERRAGHRLDAAGLPARTSPTASSMTASTGRPRRLDCRPSPLGPPTVLRHPLATMQSYLPELKVLRDFVDRLEMLFEEGQSEALAWGRHTALVVNRHFLGVPELATALEMLAAEKFVKMIAFLKSQVCQRVRTNNHVERVNRKLRYEEKSRYKWRTRHTTVRFLVLLMDRYWRRERAIWNRWPDEPKEEQPGDRETWARDRPGSVKWHDRASRGCRVQREVSQIPRSRLRISRAFLQQRVDQLPVDLLLAVRP